MHRRWLLEHNLPGYTSDRANNILQEELKMCLVAAEKYRCNYYAWAYRIWLMDTFVHGNPLVSLAICRGNVSCDCLLHANHSLDVLVV